MANEGALSCYITGGCPRTRAYKTAQKPGAPNASGFLVWQLRHTRNDVTHPCAAFSTAVKPGECKHHPSAQPCSCGRALPRAGRGITFQTEIVALRNVEHET